MKRIVIIKKQTHEQKELLDEIASIAEKAFRRGYQQGALFQPSEEHATTFRFNNQGAFYRTSPIPPTKSNPKTTQYLTAIERLRVESHGDKYKHITALLELDPEQHRLK
jgi:hypothetical protein